jgi:hypothetical protein
LRKKTFLKRILKLKIFGFFKSKKTEILGCGGGGEVGAEVEGGGQTAGGGGGCSENFIRIFYSN